VTVVTVVCGGVISLALLAALSGAGIVGLGDSAACMAGLSTGAAAAVGFDGSAVDVVVVADVASTDDLLVGVAAFFLLATLTVLLAGVVAVFFVAAIAPDVLADALDFSLSETGEVCASVFVVSTVVEAVEVSCVALLGVAEVLTTSSAAGVTGSFEGGVVFFAIFKTCPY